MKPCSILRLGRALSAALVMHIVLFAAPARGGERIEYNRDIRPILAENCFACHNAKQRKGKFDMSTYESFRKGGSDDPIVPGKPDESSLVDRLNATDKSRMPPKETRVTSNSVNVDCKLVRPMATPGVNRAKSVNRRPLIGKLWICWVSMTWLISVRVVSTGGTSVLTVTVSPTVATFSVMLTVAAWPTVSWIFVWVYFAKPG